MLFQMNVMLREAQKTVLIVRTNGNSLHFGLGNKEPVCANAALLCRDDVLAPAPAPRCFEHSQGFSHLSCWKAAGSCFAGLGCPGGQAAQRRDFG